MYQIKAQAGYEIQVIGKGERGHCRVVNNLYSICCKGTYAECVAWLLDRGIRLIQRGFERV